MQSRDLVEAHRLVFFSAKLYDHQGRSPGGVIPTPLLHWRRWRNTENGRWLNDPPATNRGSQEPATNSLINYYPSVTCSHLSPPLTPAVVTGLGAPMRTYTYCGPRAFDRPRLDQCQLVNTVVGRAMRCVVACGE